MTTKLVSPQDLIDEMAAVEDFLDPELEVAEYEVVIGELNDELKRLYSVMHRRVEELELRLNEMRREFPPTHLIFSALLGVGPDPQLVSMKREAKERAKEIETLKFFLFRGIEAIFPEADEAEASGVRTGFKVVVWDPENVPKEDPQEHFQAGPFVVRV